MEKVRQDNRDIVFFRVVAVNAFFERLFDAEGEGGALVEDTFDFEAASEQSSELQTNGQSKARTTVLSLG